MFMSVPAHRTQWGNSKLYGQAKKQQNNGGIQLHDKLDELSKTLGRNANGQISRYDKLSNFNQWGNIKDNVNEVYKHIRHAICDCEKYEIPREKLEGTQEIVV